MSIKQTSDVDIPETRHVTLLMEEDQLPCEIYMEDIPVFPPVPEQFARMSAKEKRESKLRSLSIDKYLKEEGKRLDPMNHINLILLGPADSGKSTILKQMKLLHGGFTDESRAEYKNQLYSNIVGGLKTIVSGLHKLQIVLTPTELELGQKVSHLSLGDLASNPTAYPAMLKQFLQIPSISQAVAMGDKIGLNDTAKELFARLDDLLVNQYIPTDQDILLCRTRTEHISDTTFEINSMFWHIIDVAGQREKRSRWTVYFEKNLSGMIYLLSLASFCQMMEEDPSVNRLHDSIQLFASLLANPFLKLKSIIIFFNKYDLVDERLMRYRIADFLADYQGFGLTTGENDKKGWLTWIDNKFSEMAEKAQVLIHKHKTTATDPKLMKKVIESVQEVIFRDRSKALGLM